MKEKDRSTQQFFIGIIADEQFKELALAVLPELEDKLNAEIDLRSYTDEIEQIFFTPVLTLDEEEIEEVSYDAGEKRLSLRKRILVDIGEKPNKENFSKLISKSLVEQIREIKAVPKTLVEKFGWILVIKE